MRIVKDHLDFKDLVSRVLTFDYIGALVASLLFPLFLVPQLGLVRTSLLFGMFNAAVGLWGTWLLRPLVPGSRHRAAHAGHCWCSCCSASLMAKAERSRRWPRTHLSRRDRLHADDDRISASSSRKDGRASSCTSTAICNSAPPTSTAITRRWSTRRWLLAGDPRRVLILGGGDGLALREVLRLPQVEAVTLVDLDPEMTGFPSAFRRWRN